MFDIDLNVYLTINSQCLKFLSDLKSLSHVLSKNIYFQYICINTFHSVSFGRKQVPKNAFGVSPVLKVYQLKPLVHVAILTSDIMQLPYPRQS